MVMKPVTTTVKSIIFHTLRRYEFLCITRPNAIIFKLASVQKIAKKYFSVDSLNDNKFYFLNELKIYS